ncbi:50S ribosomal protein L25/general stress protein Ctc [Swingsia samuiensis]|uniref:Large ribosomal subunit protein bL25 n=1 Tax=Swingsia samuiensis TaxID=1293412 RepID=A0A4Y6UHB2_9PROT|nr:50S ribosomal protein L25/general stress protein Ctc [Swingsia samuiensis]QDH16963.1 50S ribosomal protein L25/general stress protein Ctc [Swingsia samuiensis]
MAKLTSLKVSKRAKAGKGAARATRREGLVPAVIYGGKKEPAIIAIDPRLIIKEFHRGGWASRVYNLKIEGGDRASVLIRDVQFHPVSDAPLHIDFQRVSAGEKVHVQVSVVFEGEDAAPGIKRGGVLNIVQHAVEVEADPSNIPEHFVADLTGLDIHDTIRWADLSGTEHVELLGNQAEEDADIVIASIAPPTIEEEPEEGEDGEEGEENKDKEEKK